MKRKNLLFTIILSIFIIITSVFLYGDLIYQFEDRNLKVVIVNEDIGTEYLNEEIYLGNTFIQLVEKDQDITWSVTNRSRAEELLNKNQCDVVIYIPYDFSEKSMQLNEESPIVSLVTYKINPASEYIVSRDVDEFLVEFKLLLNQKLTSLYFDVALQAIDSAKGKIDTIIIEQREIQDYLGEQFSKEFTVIQNNINEVVTQMGYDVVDLKTTGHDINTIESSEEAQGKNLDNFEKSILAFGNDVTTKRDIYVSNIINTKTGAGGLDEKAQEIHQNLVILKAHLSDGMVDTTSITTDALMVSLENYFQFDVNGDSTTILALITTLEQYTKDVIDNKAVIEAKLQYYYGNNMDMDVIFASGNPRQAFENAKVLSFDQLKQTKFYSDEVASQLNGIDRVLYEGKQTSYGPACATLPSVYVKGMANQNEYASAMAACNSAGITNYSSVPSLNYTVNFSNVLHSITEYKIVFSINGVVQAPTTFYGNDTNSVNFSIDVSGFNGVVEVMVVSVEEFFFDWSSYVGSATLTSTTILSVDLGKIAELMIIHQTYLDIESRVNNLDTNGYVAANNQVAIPQNIHDDADKLFEYYSVILKMEADLNSYYATINGLNATVSGLKTKIESLITQVETNIDNTEAYIVLTQTYNSDLDTHKGYLDGFVVTTGDFDTEALALYTESLSILKSVQDLGAYNQGLVESKEVFQTKTAGMEQSTKKYRSSFDGVVSTHETQVSGNESYYSEYQTIFQHSYQEGVKNKDLIEYLTKPVAIEGNELEQGYLLIPYFTILLIYSISLIIAIYYMQNDKGRKITFQYLGLHATISGVIIGFISGLLLGQAVTTLLLWIVVIVLMSVTFTLAQYTIVKYLNIAGYAVILAILLLYLAVNGVFTIQSSNLLYQILGSVSVLKYFDQVLRAVLFAVPWNAILFIFSCGIVIAGIIALSFYEKGKELVE